MTDDAPTLGHNNPPEPIAPKTLQEDLAERYADLSKRVDELLKLVEAAPAEVKDEATFKPLSDLLKAGRVALAMSESTRKIENEESRRRTAMIDSWFKNPADKLALALKAVKERTDVYLEEVKAAEKKRRDEEAERKRIAAEEKRWDSIWEEARGELAIYDARKADEMAAAQRKIKEAAARRADHLRDRVKRLRLVEPYLAQRAERRRLADEAKAEADRKAAADEAELLEADRVAAERRAETKRKAQEDEERLRLAQEATAAKLAEEKKATDAARRQETKAKGQAQDHAVKAEEHADAAEDLGGAADRLDKRADRAERHANASGADMSRQRSELGTVSSVSKSWKVIEVDRNKLDLNLLRGFLHPDAVDVAVRGYMMAHKNDPGGPKLEGAVFDQVEEGVYR